MATTVALRIRPRPLSGPATHRYPWPVRSLVLSAVAHALAVGGIIAAAFLWRSEPNRTYIVTLTPSIPALGSPVGKPSTVTSPTPRVEPPSPPAKTAPAESPVQPARPAPSKASPAPDLPARETAPKVARPAAPPDLPSRTATRIPEMPTRALPRETPRSAQKELPDVSPSSPATTASKAGPSVSAREPASPPPPLGRPTGVAQGAGTAASVDGDFPFQWYLTAVQRKVHEQWVQPRTSPQGQRAVITFEIARSGEVTGARIEKTSGDAAYDLAALRAVTAANPLPPLPAEFKGTVIRVHFGFEYTGRG